MPSSSPSRREEQPAPSPAESPDCAELLRDVLLAVLHRLHHVEILRGAGLVCRAWRLAAREEPELWRRIDMRFHEDVFTAFDLDDMAREAVKRAGAQCEAFCGVGLGDDFLLWLGERVPSLKSLHLIDCYNVSTEGFTEAIKKFTLLEELELSNVGEEVFKVDSKMCPQLKHFKLRKPFFYLFEDGDDKHNDKEASELQQCTSYAPFSLLAITSPKKD